MVQPWKALSPMRVTLSGTMKFTSAVQPWNICLPMVVSLGATKVVRFRLL